jgi:predicted nucleic acid-binding protein
MSSGILDSSVLIDCLRGHAGAVAFLRSHTVVIGGPPTTHLLVVAELYAGARDARELRAVQSFLAPFQLTVPNERDGLAALDLFRQHRLSHGVDWPDCQIAATALRLGVEVLTLNVKHFSAFPGLRVVRPY